MVPQIVMNSPPFALLMVLTPRSVRWLLARWPRCVKIFSFSYLIKIINLCHNIRNQIFKSNSPYRARRVSLGRSSRICGRNISLRKILTRQEILYSAELVSKFDVDIQARNFDLDKTVYTFPLVMTDSFGFGVYHTRVKFNHIVFIKLVIDKIYVNVILCTCSENINIIFSVI